MRRQHGADGCSLAETDVWCAGKPPSPEMVQEVCLRYIVDKDTGSHYCYFPEIVCMA